MLTIRGTDSGTSYFYREGKLVAVVDEIDDGTMQGRQTCAEGPDGFHVPTCGGFTLVCASDDAQTLDAESDASTNGEASNGITPDGGFLDAVGDALVLTGCPSGPIEVNMGNGWVAPTGTCDPGTMCVLTTLLRCDNGIEGGVFEWACMCSAGNWACKLGAENYPGCPDLEGGRPVP